ncbi:hypothetical protein [uncultured Legionella sp.]|uniref:hypothetical protein n=1 Tax=uncultured Legionella sp. TaxID=210934 RepID=UPI002609ABE7|nr:hypothetical protein [uncultured Legionella sp.]
MQYLSALLLLGLMGSYPAYAHEHMKDKITNPSIIQVVIENAPGKITANTTETLRLQLLKE